MMPTTTHEPGLSFIGATALTPCSGLALHYAFEQVYLDGPLLIPRRCRIQVFRPDRRLALQGAFTVVVCSPLEETFCSQHTAPIATTAWHLLGRPTELTWIMRWWKELAQDYPPFEEYLIQPEFECIQFRHEGDGILSSPAFISVGRSEVEALVGPLPMLRRPIPAEAIHIFQPPTLPGEA